MQFIKFYTENAIKGVGVQGVTWLYPPTTNSLVYIFVPNHMGGFTVLRTVDNILLYVCVGFACFAGYIGGGVYLNVKWRTSEPDKLKLKKAVTPRSIHEISSIIFGDRPTILDFFLPTKVRFNKQ